MRDELNTVTYRCGSVGMIPGTDVAFNDLAETRSRPLARRVGLLRAVELVRAIGGSEACASAPVLVIDDENDLKDENEQAIVALLLEAAGSQLKVAGKPVTTELFDADPDMAEVLTVFAEVGIPARLDSLDFGTEDWEAAAAWYLCADLGLTGKPAAWAMNLAANTGRFTEGGALYFASKPRPDQGALHLLREMFLDQPVDPALFPQLLGTGITVVDPVGSLGGTNPRFVKEVFALYNRFQPGSITMSPHPTGPPLRMSQQETLERVMEVLVPVRRRAYATRHWAPTCRLHARHYALKLAGQGATRSAIAQALNEEGFRVTRVGRWNRKSVSKLLVTSIQR